MYGKVGSATEERAQCVACMKFKKCRITRELKGGKKKTYDNFFHSEKHRGWLCKQCWNRAYKEA